MQKNSLIKITEEMVKAQQLNEGSGHDWWHTWRVWRLARRIGEEEKANFFIVELAALLHDIADWKSNNGDIYIGGKSARNWLESLKIDEPSIKQIVDIVDNVSFKGAGVKDKMKSLEGKVVQDADRLDAIGAVGVGRVFTYGGSKGRVMYNPETPIQIAQDFETYKSAGQTSINHFYEKLLLLKNRMHTKTGKKLAEARHKFMEGFLEEFYTEWNGKK